MPPNYSNNYSINIYIYIYISKIYFYFICSVPTFVSCCGYSAYTDLLLLRKFLRSDLRIPCPCILLLALSALNASGRKLQIATHRSAFFQLVLWSCERGLPGVREHSELLAGSDEEMSQYRPRRAYVEQFW